MKTIELTQGYVTQVDDSDYDWLRQYNWHVNISGVYKYAETTTGGRIKMHTLIMPNKDKWVDHIDGNGLNNQRSNLRYATRTENVRNSRKLGKFSSLYKGVCWKKGHNKWLATIRVEGKIKHLGYFLCEIEAAEAYDTAAHLYYGAFAKTNF